jgi:endonuclease YncB( thermonuclease family)
MLCFCKKNIVDIDDAPIFTLKNKYLHCKIISVYDGDTVTIIFPWNKKPYKKSCRLAGIDTPEIRTKNPDEKVAAINAKIWLSKQILNKLVWIRFEKEDKYGRLLGHIYRHKNDKCSMNEYLVIQKMACVYNGGKKKVFE